MQDGEHLRLVVEAAPIAIVVADADGRITLINEQGERLFGYDHGELLGRPIESLVPARFRGAQSDLPLGYLGAPATRTVGAGRELFGLRKDGSEVPIEIGLNLIARPQGDFTVATVIDITERRRAEEHFRSVIEAAPNAMLMVDRTGAVTLVNAQTERLFGYAREELLGAPVESLVPERFRAGHGALRAGFHGAPSARAMGAGRDLFGLRKDGTEVPIEIGLNPLSTPQGEFVLASVIDITERKHAEEMRLQRDRAVDASQFKTQFVATMSHELRTPLNVIIGAAELLTAMNLDERQRSYVETIDESAEALLSIISSILDFSKIEAGKIDLETRDIELELAVAKAAAMLAPQARDKGLTLHAYVDPLIPRTLRGDQDRLRQILLNLVGNAVKFTDRGSVSVRAISVETSTRYARVRFEVQDSGIGIDETTLPKLFEPFVQADTSASRMYGGTGLGLSICKRLVELMDGAIGVTSEPGSGSLFWFTARFGRPSVVGSSRHVYGVRAVVVSSDQPFCDVVSRYVESWGIPARSVLDAAQVRDALSGGDGAENADDAVDWIAIVDGDDAATAPALDLLRESPFVGRQRIISIGRNERLTKPIGEAQLFERIAEGLGETGEIPQPPAPAPVEGGAPAGMVLIVEDDARIQEILGHQFAALGIPAQTVSDGVEAVEAVLRDRFSMVFMDCHMPNMDGFEATRVIRAAESRTGGHVPIVAMTANAFKEDREACLAAGMDDYLSKPLRMNDLRAMAQRWMGTAPSGATAGSR
jgi:two-component system, sensor histidine kinase and response regulator